MLRPLRCLPTWLHGLAGGEGETGGQSGLREPGGCESGTLATIVKQTQQAGEHNPYNDKTWQRAAAMAGRAGALGKAGRGPAERQQGKPRQAQGTVAGRRAGGMRRPTQSVTMAGRWARQRADPGPPPTQTNDHPMTPTGGVLGAMAKGFTAAQLSLRVRGARSEEPTAGRAGSLARLERSTPGDSIPHRPTHRRPTRTLT